MKTFKELREMTAPKNVRSPLDKQVFNQHLLMKYKLSIPTEDNNLFNAENVPIKAGKHIGVDRDEEEDQSDGYTAPIVFGAYLNRLLDMRSEGIELSDEDNELLDESLNLDEEEFIALCEKHIEIDIDDDEDDDEDEESDEHEESESDEEEEEEHEDEKPIKVKKGMEESTHRGPFVDKTLQSTMGKSAVPTKGADTDKPDDSGRVKRKDGESYNDYQERLYQSIRAQMKKPVKEEALDEQVLATHGNITVKREKDKDGDTATTVHHKTKGKVATGYYDRDSDSIWFDNHKKPGQKSFNSHAEIAKHYHGLHEEALDELSKDTLTSYKGKAEKVLGQLRKKSSAAYKNANFDAMDKYSKAGINKQVGIAAADQRLKTGKYSTRKDKYVKRNHFTEETE